MLVQRILAFCIIMKTRQVYLYVSLDLNPAIKHTSPRIVLHVRLHKALNVISMALGLIGALMGTGTQCSAIMRGFICSDFLFLVGRGLLYSEPAEAY